MMRYDVINHFTQSRDFFSFLEIGTDNGESYNRITAPVRISVDPDLRTNATYHMTSDEFFSLSSTFRPVEFDIIFIDGLHEHNQAYRDIRNAMSVLSGDGVIIVHDCLPQSERMQEYPQSPFNYVWTGDVWKAFLKMRSELPYELYTIDSDFGIGVIDTTLKKKTPTAKLPKNMDAMTYEQFVKNRNHWMNVKEDIIHD